MRTIEFHGVKIEYDERCPLSWKWQKAVGSGDQVRMVRAIEQLLCGRDEEYADALCDNGDTEAPDTSFDLMIELIGKVTEDMGGKAKN